MGFFLFNEDAAAEVLWDTFNKAVCNMAMFH